MQVVLSTIGRFHTFDLARQLDKRKALKAVFSGYPKFKLRREGLASHQVRSFPWLHTPLMSGFLSQAWLKRQWQWQDRVWFDRFVAANLPDADLFHALSGSALRSGRAAKNRGIRYLCDRGSSHIRYQHEILTEEYSAHGLAFAGVDPRVAEMEESEYDLADSITVPSHFARDTFLARGISAQKVCVVPYGVELSRFRPTGAPPDDEFRVLFAGSICIRKGIPYLLQAYDKLDHPRKKLILVGGVEAQIERLLLPYRNRADVEFRGHLPQAELASAMSTSHAMVLPSVEEGLALVQAQALACGCPVIASTNTGSPDLFEDGRQGFIVPIRNAEAIRLRLQQLADDPALRDTMSRLAVAQVSSIGGWERYGDIMFGLFERVLSLREVAA